jgi:hypothetical protein
MGWSEKIHCRANGEAVFYWMIPLYFKSQQKCLDRRAATESQDEKKGHRNGLEIELEIKGMIGLTFSSKKLDRMEKHM